MPMLVEPQSKDLEPMTDQFQAVHDRLKNWIAHPEEFVEEGIIAPSHETIELAIQHVLKPLSNSGVACQVVADTHGGIVFERRNNADFESIRVTADGRIEQCRFQEGRLVDRQMWR